MNSAGTLPLTVVILLTAALLAPLLARWRREAPLAVSVLALCGSGVILAGHAPEVYRGHLVTEFLSGQRPVHGASLGIAMVADPFGLTFALLTVGVGVVLMVAVLSELAHLGARELGGLTCLITLLLASLVGAALAADTINLFVWFEVAALSSYGLTGFFLERPIALEAAFKNLVLTSSAGFILFVGDAILYDVTGSLNLGQLRTGIVNPNHAALLGAALTLAAFATKAGLVPVHGWLPDTHTPVPGPVSALFSGLMVGLGMVGLVRMVRLVLPSGTHALGWLTVIGVVSAIGGALLALVQDDLKRLLAWDTVSQFGVLAFGFAAADPKADAGAVYHLVNHGLFKALLFLCAGAVVHATGETQLSRLGGLWRQRRLLALAFVVACAAIAGIPPMNGYASLGLIHHGLDAHPAVLIAALVAQVLTVAALGRAAWLGFLRPRRQPYEHLEPLRAGQRAALIVLSAACLGFGVLANFFVSHVAAQVAGELADPGGYAAAALGAKVSVARAAVHFDYLDTSTMLLTLVELVAGVAVLLLVLRRPAVLAPARLLQRVHTGSVNDFVVYWTLGVVAVSTVLLA